jgi:hypothetical protein
MCQQCVDNAGALMYERHDGLTGQEALPHVIAGSG